MGVPKGGRESSAFFFSGLSSLALFYFFFTPFYRERERGGSETFHALLLRSV